MAPACNQHSDAALVSEGLPDDDSNADRCVAQQPQSPPMVTCPQTTKGSQQVMLQTPSQPACEQQIANVRFSDAGQDEPDLVSSTRIPADTEGQAQPTCSRQHALPWEELFKLMQDRDAIADDAELPETGMPQLVERLLSPIFISRHELNGGAYGTRTQTVIAAWHDGHVTVRERNLTLASSWKETQHDFVLAE